MCLKKIKREEKQTNKQIPNEAGPLWTQMDLTIMHSSTLQIKICKVVIQVHEIMLTLQLLEQKSTK